MRFTRLSHRPHARPSVRGVAAGSPHHNERIWRRQLAAALGAAALLIGSLPSAVAADEPARPADTFVAAWDAIGVQAASAAALTPPDGHILFAYVAIAEYDAVTAVQEDYEPFAVDLDAPHGTSAEAAVVAAAHTVLVHYLPTQAATILNPAYATSLAGIADGTGKDRRHRAGRAGGRRPHRIAGG